MTPFIQRVTYSDRLYLKQKHGRGGLINIKICVRLEENNLGLYMRGSKKMLLKDVNKVSIVKTENCMEKQDFKKNSQNEFKNEWHEKRMYGQFVREIPEEIGKDLSLKRLVQNDLKGQTEVMICAAQEQVLRKNYTRNKTDKTLANPLCRIYVERGETVPHIICERKNLAQRECKRRPDTIAKLVHWKLREKHNLEGKEEWYEHCPDRVVGDDDVELI